MYDVDSVVFEKIRNDELRRLYRDPSICQFIRGKMIERAGRVRRLEGCSIKKVRGVQPDWKESPGETTGLIQ